MDWFYSLHDVCAQYFQCKSMAQGLKFEIDISKFGRGIYGGRRATGVWGYSKLIQQDSSHADCGKNVGWDQRNDEKTLLECT